MWVRVFLYLYLQPTFCFHYFLWPIHCALVSCPIVMPSFASSPLVLLFLWPFCTLPSNYYCVIIYSFLSRWYFIEFKMRLIFSLHLSFSPALSPFSPYRSNRASSFVCRNSHDILRSIPSFPMRFHWILFQNIFIQKHFQFNEHRTPFVFHCFIASNR